MSKLIKLYFDEANGQYCLLNGQLVTERSEDTIYSFLDFVVEVEAVLFPIANFLDAKMCFVEWLYSSSESPGPNETAGKHMNLTVGFSAIIRDVKKQPVGLNERLASDYFLLGWGSKVFAQLYRSLHELRKYTHNPNINNQFYSLN